MPSPQAGARSASGGIRDASLRFLLRRAETGTDVEQVCHGDN